MNFGSEKVWSQDLLSDRFSFDGICEKKRRRSEGLLQGNRRVIGAWSEWGVVRTWWGGVGRAPIDWRAAVEFFENDQRSMTLINSVGGWINQWWQLWGPGVVDDCSAKSGSVLILLVEACRWWWLRFHMWRRSESQGCWLQLTCKWSGSLRLLQWGKRWKEVIGWCLMTKMILMESLLIFFALLTRWRVCFVFLYLIIFYSIEEF